MWGLLLKGPQPPSLTAHSRPSVPGPEHTAPREPTGQTGPQAGAATGPGSQVPHKTAVRHRSSLVRPGCPRRLGQGQAPRHVLHQQLALPFGNRARSHVTSLTSSRQWTLWDGTLLVHLHVPL